MHRLVRVHQWQVAGEATLAREHQGGRRTLCCSPQQEQSEGSTAGGANAEIGTAGSSPRPFLFALAKDLQLVLEGHAVPVFKL